jgi:hypothetical protein
MIKKHSLSGLTFLVCLSFCIIGCELNPEPKAIIYNKDSATSTNMISFNTTNAAYLATQWANEDSGDRSAAREGEDTTAESSVKNQNSLVAVVDDGNGGFTEDDSVMDKEPRLADWCQPRPVREVYKCPYPTIEYEAKGFYTVFSDRIDTNNDSWWQYEDGTPAPNVGQILYVKPTGEVIEILNFENDVNRQLATWIKENDGEDYIQFDDNGNIFILTSDYSVGKTVVYRYNPMNDKVDGYTLDKNGDIGIRNFRVTRDGKWIFLNVMERHRENNVYAMQVNSRAKPINMYQYSGETPALGEEPQWAVSSIEINPTTNEVYWYVCTYLDDTRQDTGLYVASRRTNGEYTKERVKHYYSVPIWCLENAIDKYLKHPDKPEYSKLLAYIKDMCKSTTNNLDDVVFTLKYFKDCWAPVKEWDGSEYECDFSLLYKEDDEGNPLTDEAALKYLYETKLRDCYAGEKRTDENLFDLFRKYYNDYWKEPEYDESGILRNGNRGYLTEGYKSGFVFPWDKVLINKKTGESAVNTNYFRGYYAEKDSGYILSNDEGVWLLNDVWDSNANGGAGGEIYSNAYRLTDEKGNFAYEQPGDILNQQFCTRSACRRPDNATEKDPWYKNPISVNTSAMAALSVDKKTIYYHKEGLTIDLLANDENKANIKSIYSFILEEDQLIYNAEAIDQSNGKYFMVSIDLTTKEANLLPLTKRVESMMGIWEE